jgi:cyclophilin family peptidyl-prolyl cis-trans isomerase
MVIEDYGSMIIEVYSEKVPKTAENFIELCEKKYYNDTIFHRLIKDFMVIKYYYLTCI